MVTKYCIFDVIDRINDGISEKEQVVDAEVRDVHICSRVRVLSGCVQDIGEGFPAHRQVHIH